MKKATKESVIQIIKDQIKAKDFTIKDLDKQEYLTKKVEELEK